MWLHCSVYSTDELQLYTLRTTNCLLQIAGFNANLCWKMLKVRLVDMMKKKSGENSKELNHTNSAYVQCTYINTLLTRTGRQVVGLFRFPMLSRSLSVTFTLPKTLILYTLVYVLPVQFSWSTSYTNFITVHLSYLEFKL